VTNRTVSQSERRRSYRAEIAFPVTYTIEGHDAVEATAMDISADGLRLLCKPALRTAQGIDLSFALPEIPVREAIRKLGRKPSAVTFEPLRVHGRILTATYDPERRSHIHGIAFEAVPAATAEAIHQFVHLTQIPRG
jgi:c-di-GMP-binding flagellar brake protein YcgR